MPYYNGLVTVASTATTVCNVAGENDGVVVQNTGSADVFLGGPNVTATGATQGVKLAAGTSLSVPTVGGPSMTLYGITASGTSTVAFLYPSR